jgi:GT2 family glycosyltransferase
VRDEQLALQVQLGTAGVRVVRAPTNAGFAGGCELGALHARGSILVFANPDVTFSTGWFDGLRRHLDDPGVSIVAPVLLDPDGTVQEAGQTLFSDAATLPHRDDLDDLDGLVREVDYASAACWVMRRDEHERLGGFDADFFPAYFEDVDLAVRARSLGGRCVVDTSVRIVHHHGQGTPDVTEPASGQRDTLLAKRPDLRWSQPSPPPDAPAY